MFYWNVSVEFIERMVNGSLSFAREDFEDRLMDEGFIMEYVVAAADVACYEVRHKDPFAFAMFLLKDHEPNMKVIITETGEVPYDVRRRIEGRRN